MLHDYLRIINSAKLAMEARLQALSELQQTEKIVNTKKERKEKVAGSPKAGAIEQEYQETVKKQESAKEEFEMITEILRKELDRFEKTKGREIAKALKDYAKENMDTTVQILDQWKKLLDQLQSI
jgi:L-fucose mutarotase/ribose pyranase (RbsD/FucU family)